MDDVNPPSAVLVLGIGNMLWADEGFGVRAVEALHQRFELPESVTVMDGGTQGLLLLDPVCSASHVVVFDAIDFGLEPGTLKVMRDREVPSFSDTTMSLHQASFMELLSLADLKGRFPERLTVVGVQPAILDDLGGSLSDTVAARLDEAVALGVAELRAWGLPVLERRAPPAEKLNAAPLSRALYEGERPSAADACRVGDARFMPAEHVALAADPQER